MDRRRIVHVLNTPYSAVEWPQISQDDQDAILELLCSLLTPLGTYRAAHIVPSKGKRKRARTDDLAEHSSSARPPAPELTRYVDVGMSCISRSLQGRASVTGTAGPPSQQAPETTPKPYTLVFVARSGVSSAFHCHFPQMVALSASSRPSDPPIRLVGFSKSCQERLSVALGLPRVSSIALREGAPQAKGLLDFVREHVEPIAMSSIPTNGYRDTNIDAVQTKIGTARPKKAKNA
ncbi:hypothetical protein QBC39DRAFT_183512 [Podospora conica]|nr:hypothetical protein QBC39DRAFT_183512 [Schizothecium conicum]